MQERRPPGCATLGATRPRAWWEQERCAGRRVRAAEGRRARGAIASRVRELLAAGDRPLILGGDCTLLLGVFSAVPHGTGLWFVDGHADFFDGESSPTGEAADMDLAILTGHGP